VDFTSATIPVLNSLHEHPTKQG